MRRTAALLLLMVFIFNWGGYRVLFFVMEQRSVTALTAQIDRNEYLPEDLFELSIPLDLPYQNEQSDFERVDGDVQVNGEFYHYVKRKISGNRLIIQCIRNTERVTLAQSAKQFSSGVTDAPDAANAKKLNGQAKKSKTISPDYYSLSNNCHELHTTAGRISFSTLRSTLYRCQHRPMPYIPPELFVA